MLKIFTKNLTTFPRPKPPSPGNVLEWWSDWYSRDYYSVSPWKSPKGPIRALCRVLRGGIFVSEAFDLRTYARSAAWPSFLGYRLVGLRPVREP